MGFLEHIGLGSAGADIDNFFNATLIHPAESFIGNTVGNFNRVHDAVGDTAGAAAHAAKGVGDGIHDAGESAGDISKQLAKILPYAAVGFGGIMLLSVMPRRGS